MPEAFNLDLNELSSELSTEDLATLSDSLKTETPLEEVTQIDDSQNIESLLPEALPSTNLEASASITTTSIATTESLTLLRKFPYIPPFYLIEGTPYSDLIFDTPKNDLILARGGNDWVIAWRGGNDVIYGEGGNDLLYGGIGNDSLYGGIGKDSLYGASGNDYLSGGGDGDKLYGGSGSDYMYGDSGFYIYPLYSSTTTSSTITSSNSLTYYPYPYPYPAGGNDLMYGGSGNDYMYGGGGSDTIDGGNDNDVLYGDSGNYFYPYPYLSTSYYYPYPSGGNDKLSGGKGNDKLYGEAGNDKLDGGIGKDYLEGGNGNDSINGGKGDDTIVGNTRFFPFVIAYAETAEITTDAGTQDALTGGVSTVGSFESDALTVNSDSLVSDKLIIDYPIFYSDKDTLTGGSGADDFVFYSPYQGIDTVKDFKQYQGDEIHVSRYGFGGGLTLGTLQSEQFTLGTSAQDADDRFIYNKKTGDLFFDADGTGVRRQVQFAKLSGAPSLDFSDIVVI
ncbi:MAG: calcium-binding protein [Symploca sp. SIO3C6]|nr:calcium-binding protein [Symploca sp. SIO3C6]